MTPWPEIVETVRKEHNGVFRVDLCFGHDGDNICRFSDYDKAIAKGESGSSMQEAVERCYANWRLVQDVSFATRVGDRYENWTHEHAEVYGVCASIPAGGANG